MTSAIAKKIPWNWNAETNLIAYKNVHTVCEESRCPNRHECSSMGVATFLIGGRECTRACRFCHIATAKPIPLAQIADKEHDDIVHAAVAGKYNYLVITSVARDDDEAGLAAHFARITESLRAEGVTVELLIPDFHNNPKHLAKIASARPAVIAHNMETVSRLSPRIRPQANYRRSLDVFQFFRENHPEIIRKSAFMVGLGEAHDEISTLLDDMKAAAIDIVSVGQYLKPSAEQADVIRNYTVQEFERLEQEVERRQFLAYEVGPYVRSSYMAANTMLKLQRERAKRGADIHA